MFVTMKTVVNLRVNTSLAALLQLLGTPMPLARSTLQLETYTSRETVLTIYEEIVPAMLLTATRIGQYEDASPVVVGS